MFILSLAFSKLSICVLLLRILQGSDEPLKKTFLYFTIGILVVVTALSLGLQLGQCTPVAKIWDPVVAGRCGSPMLQVGSAYVNGGESCLSTMRCQNGQGENLTWRATVVAAWVDFSLAAFPVTFIKDLALSKREKLVLVALMSMGVL